MPKYQITINFETDRELTPEEQFQIVGACQVQVEVWNRMGDVEPGSSSRSTNTA